MKGKTVLITGGSSGIGKATAELFASEGANVAITGRDEDKLQNVAREIGAFGIHADVANEKDVKRTYEELAGQFEGLDVLINNAGIGGYYSEISDMDFAEMRRIYDVNVFGAAMMAKEAAKIFKKQKYGDIVNIASTAALKGYKTGTSYASSKFALRGMTQCWQQELRHFNVRVILVNPSEVPTAFGQESREERSNVPNKLHSEDIAHAILSTLTMDPRGYVPEITVHATNPF